MGKELFCLLSLEVEVGQSTLLDWIGTKLVYSLSLGEGNWQPRVTWTMSSFEVGRWPSFPVISVNPNHCVSLQIKFWTFARSVLPKLSLEKIASHRDSQTRVGNEGEERKSSMQSLRAFSPQVRNQNNSYFNTVFYWKISFSGCTDWYLGSFPTRYGARVPAVKALGANHWTIRDSLNAIFLKNTH